MALDQHLEQGFIGHAQVTHVDTAVAFEIVAGVLTPFARIASTSTTQTRRTFSTSIFAHPTIPIPCSRRSAPLPRPVPENGQKPNG